MKRSIVALMTTVMIGSTLLAGCAGNDASADSGSNTTDTTQEASAGDEAGTEDADEDTAAGGASGPITIVSREDGSGTRGAFVELFGIEEEVNGEKVDMTTEEAKITNSTSVMMTTVQGDVNAIGYISLGSLNETVKAAKIDGAEATAENIESGSYQVVRPFNVAAKEDLSEVASDFMAFIMSTEGQAVVEENGYIPVSDVKAYEGNKPAGKVVVAGSSSVTPVMEKLKEAYAAVNPDAEIEVQQSDSTTGMQSAIDGLCDIGMASRELKDSETKAGLVPTVIAQDGIAVIVNNESGIDELTSDQVKGIYTGEILDWEDLN
ncbi:substrate-binding domain-containing protein [Ruminococcus sp. OA3]|nr:substrate-binding domain-containing protein [Ruminococcus sp. OA3]MCH1983090.1 substrate-binding domain-containing protein [Ruminococcus sp. OA3]